MVNDHLVGCATPENCWCEVRRYGLILGIAIIILIIEVFGGFVSHSLALLADAGHVFVDIGATFVAIIVACCVKRGALEAQTRKIGGYINALLLGCISVWVFVEAIIRFLNPPHEILSWVMVSIAVLGTIGNYIQHRIIKSTNEKHITHKSMQFHIFSDLLQSVGVVFGGILIWMTDWFLIDPIISIIISFVMARWTYQLLRVLYLGKYDGGHGCCH